MNSLWFHHLSITWRPWIRTVGNYILDAGVYLPLRLEIHALFQHLKLIWKKFSVRGAFKDSSSNIDHFNWGLLKVLSIALLWFMFYKYIIFSLIDGGGFILLLSAQHLVETLNPQDSVKRKKRSFPQLFQWSLPHSTEYYLSSLLFIPVSSSEIFCQKPWKERTVKKPGNIRCIHTRKQRENWN